MILSILVIGKKAKRRLVITIGGTLFCILFARIYNFFGHGVTSGYMNWMCLYPLILGCGMYFVLIGRHLLEKVSGNAERFYGWGIITLVFGNMLRGIFEIAGTSSPYVTVYWIVGGVLVLIGLMLFGRDIGGKRK